MDTINIYRKVIEELQAGRRAAVVTQLAGTPTRMMSEKSFIPENVLSGGTAEHLHILARQAAVSGRLLFENKMPQDITIAEPYFPESHLIILGGGHIARPLCEFSAKCGFSVTVVDDRPSFANKQRFPEAKLVICESFDRCFPLLHINKSSFVVIITRGHRHDLDCLRQVLKLDTAYTGMIGSRRRVRAAMEQLLGEGFSQEKLDAVRAPIGLDIGAETPEEISISILSELIKYKRSAAASAWPELDMEVLTELASESGDPRALVTVIGTKGSTPRDVGAKMLVWPNGKTLGSIGGGCSEADVMQKSYDVIRDGGYLLMDVDMTGEVAEDEGMVCGGIMKVVIEKYS
jgi:xanthine dehydrogenase accessory factor